MSDPSSTLPALSLVASAGSAGTILDLAVEAERRGFAGLACPTLGGAIGLCVSLAHVTSTIPFFTSIQGIYGIHPHEMAGFASHVHEVSDGRFRLGSCQPRGDGPQDGHPDGSAAHRHARVRRRHARPGALLGHAPARVPRDAADPHARPRRGDRQGALWANSSLR